MSRDQELVVVDSASLAETAALRVAQLLQAAVDERSEASLALAGGTTPRALHEALARLPSVPWSRISIFFGDERSVPPDDKDSNYRMAKESLLDRVPIDFDRVHRMRAEEADRDAAARAYERLLPTSLDVLILGIGEDGHTASLFPGAASLDEETRRVIPVVGPKPPPERLTITPKVIRDARHVVMLASGKGKRGPVERSLHGAYDPRETPAQLARDGLWIVDRDAAGGT